MHHASRYGPPVCTALPEGAEDSGAPNGVTRICGEHRPCPIHDVGRARSPEQQTENLSGTSGTSRLESQRGTE